MGTLSFALIGGLWLLFLLHYELSIAPAIGFIALAGVAAEFCVIMLIYVDPAPMLSMLVLPRHTC